MLLDDELNPYLHSPTLLHDIPPELDLRPVSANNPVEKASGDTDTEQGAPDHEDAPDPKLERDN